MSLDDDVPSQWTTFVGLAKQNMPVLPSMGETEMDENRETVGRVLSVISTMLDGLNIDLPPELARGMETGGVLTAGSVVSAVTSVVEGRILSRVPGGGIIGGGLETVRGANQQLDRTHEMLTYVLGMKGYVVTLAGLALAALMSDRRDTVYPNPPIPSDVLEAGDLFTSGRRSMYLDGVNRAWRVITGVDNLRPAEQTEMHYSKGCLVHIAINTGITQVASGTDLMARRRCERLIATEILSNSLQAQREQLRRWSVS